MKSQDIAGAPGRPHEPAAALGRLQGRIVACERCPRLVAWRGEVARVRVRRFAGWDYWGRPVPSFGDPQARIVLVGLAPAAHGGNRTGRIFTGDRSGDFLFAALHRAGLASQSHSVAPGDGLTLKDAWIAAAVRCAPPGNKPTPEEQDRCRPFLEEELRHLVGVRVVIALGGLAWKAVMRCLAPEASGNRENPAFGHGAARPLPGGRTLLGSYHPSQQNTFTGRLTSAMLDDVLGIARRIAGGEAPIERSGPKGKGLRREGGSSPRGRQ